MWYFINNLGILMVAVPFVGLFSIFYLLAKIGIYNANHLLIIAIGIFFGLVVFVWDVLVRLNTALSIDKQGFPNFAKWGYGGVLVMPVYLIGLLVVFNICTYNSSFSDKGSGAIIIIGLLLTTYAHIFHDS